MSNKYPGYCVVCDRSVEAGHGELTRGASGKWVVRCSGKGTAPRQVGKGRGGVRRSEPADRTAGVRTPAEGVTTLTRLDAGKSASAFMGEAFRVGKSGGVLAGQVVVVVGAETYYESEEFNQDAGDMRGGGWRARLWVRAATDAEAAPVLAAERARADKVAAAAAAKASALAEWDRARAEATTGLVETACRPTGAAGTRVRLASHDRLVLEREEFADGSTCVRVWGTVALDMDVSSCWGAPDQVAGWRLAWARECGVTREGAAKWLAEYRGCQGTADYEALLALLPAEGVRS